MSWRSSAPPPIRAIVARGCGALCRLPSLMGSQSLECCAPTRKSESWECCECAQSWLRVRENYYPTSTHMNVARQVLLLVAWLGVSARSSPNDLRSIANSCRDLNY